MRCTVFIAASIDGYIAREDGGLDWLPEDDASGDDHGYGALFEAVDALVMGRDTYEVVLGFGAWPYGDKPVVVLSSRGLPADTPASVSRLSGTAEEIVRALAERGYTHLYVDGGRTVQDFLRAGLVTDLIVTRIPVLLGGGIPLFGRLDQDIHLRHVETRNLPGGMVQSHYSIP